MGTVASDGARHVGERSAVVGKFTKDMFTLANGVDFDIGRVLWALGVLVFLGLCVQQYSTFDPQTFGVGFGAVMLAGGGALALKRNTEPSPAPDGPPNANVREPEIRKAAARR